MVRAVTRVASGLSNTDKKFIAQPTATRRDDNSSSAESKGVRLFIQRNDEPQDRLAPLAIGDNSVDTDDKVST
jgi:hypothetical protein